MLKIAAPNRSKRIGNKIGILVVILLTFIICVLHGVTITALSQTDDMVENNYHYATLEDNFTPDIILISLTQEATLQFREYSLNDFPELRLNKITELTEQTASSVKSYISNNLARNDNIGIDIDSFRRILKLELTEKSKENVLKSINLLKKRSDILSASPNYIGEYLTTIPNDPFYAQGKQWAIDKISLPQAWDINTGSSAVLVGVLDSGIDLNHPDLTNRINQQLSRDFSFTNNPWYNIMGNPHGTHVAGIIGAESNNSPTPLGITGACWDIQLVSMKVGELYPTTAAVTQAIIYATENDINILNLSLSVKETTEMNNAINAYQGLLVCAAGNNGNTNVDYPARYDNERIISVGSTTFDDTCSSFSSRHETQVDLFAPGGDDTVNGGILSTFPESLWGINIFYYQLARGYAIDYGTSMATPYVTGVAALLLSHNPSLNALGLKTAILSNVDTPVDKNGNNLLQGLCITNGRLNAYKVLSSDHIHSHFYSPIYNRFGISTNHYKRCRYCNFSITEPHIKLGGQIICCNIAEPYRS